VNASRGARLSGALLILWVGLSAVFRAAPYAGGAPPGFSGGFGESACDACHFDNGINATPGRLTIAGVPERFAPGERYTLTVALARPEMKIGGFQLSARMEHGGAQAGTLEAAPGEEPRIAIDAASGIQYARQRREGAGPAPPGIARWEVVWTAPAASGLVQFNVAANAGDHDESVRGDYVYTLVSTSSPR
jgi:hypothetical protein